MKEDNKTKKQLVHELTELRSQNAALKKSESAERYRSLVENIRDVIYELDSQGVVLYISPAIRDQLGFDSDEIVGKNFVEFGHKDDLSSRTEWFTELRKGIEKPFEYRVLNKSGELKWARTKTRPIMEDGLFKGARGILIDVTEQRRMEEALRESEEKYRTVLEDMDDVFFEVDIKGNITFVNSSSCKMSGYSEEELLGMPFKKISAPDGIEKVMQYFGDIFLTGKTGKPFLWNLVKKNGEQGFFEIVASLIKDKQGNPTGFRGIGRDVTKRKWAEEELQQTLESLRKAVSVTIQVMVSAVEMRDPYTAGHQTRAADLARAIAAEMGFPQEKIDGILMAGSIHDIGKLSVPAEILTKSSKLTNIEFALIKEHAEKGHEMLKDVESPWPLSEMVYQHHERINGSGYPRNLKDGEIMMEARILAVADVVEAMASHRPYRASLGLSAALEEIEKNKGNLYDNDVADACLKLFREKGYMLK